MQKMSYQMSYQTDQATDERCSGCGDDVLLVTGDDGSARVQCGCSSASVLVAA